MKALTAFLTTLLVTAAVTVTGCADDASTANPAAGENAAVKEKGAYTTDENGAMGKADATASKAKGTKIILAKSEFGRMLFNSRKQAIYIFELDRKNRSNCYGECAKAWPPVFTKGKPIAGNGIKASRLGTIKRRGGKLQVTYYGKPLYYYAHEGPGEVECHNVELNGGLWWVIGANGKRRP